MFGRFLEKILEWRGLRERLAFALAWKHYDALNIRVPLSGSLIAPVTFQDGWTSFSEVFLQKEYEEVFRLVPVPDRWIDLGCHAGYFSLYAEEMRRREGRSFPPKALLLDADPRSAFAVERMRSMNMLDGAIAFQHGNPVSVPVVTPELMVKLLSPPYDLIKVDIEGSEYDFIERYRSVWQSARYLVLECHQIAGRVPTWEAGARQVIEKTNFERLPLKDHPAAARNLGAGLVVLRNPLI